MKGKNKKQVVKLKTEQDENIKSVVTEITKLETAKNLLTPSITTAKVIKGHYHKDEDVSTWLLADELQKKSKAIIDGDMAAIEDLLITQAYALNTVFSESLRTAALVGVPHPDGMRKIKDSFGKMGLKAQAQCRATLETLANIKNPPHLAFVRQQNIAYQQQVNNTHTAIVEKPLNVVDVGSNNNDTRAREKNKFSPNELLEQNSNVTRLESRKTEKTSGTHTNVETVE
jgi:hypothetical protein